MLLLRLLAYASICTRPPAGTLLSTGRSAPGHTVEMHGSINQLVCSECSAVATITPAALRSLRAKRGIPCCACEAASLRVRIMLYDDAEGAHSPFICSA